MPEQAHPKDISAGVPLVTGNMDDFPTALCLTAEVLSPALFIKRFSRLM